MATFIIEPGSASFFGSRAGDDRYVFNPANVTADRRITINDTVGVNTIFLDGGLSIASSSVATNTNGTNALQLTLSNGAMIFIGNASGFRYQTGGEGTNGQGGLIQDFNSFVTNSLGTTVPPQGGTSSGGATVVNETGGTTGGGGGGNTPTVSIAPLQSSFNEGQTAFFNVSAPGVADGTTFTYQISGTGINSADITNGSLTGSGTITNGAGVISVPLNNDNATEGNERLTVTVSVPGRANTPSATIDVIDTSTSAASFTLTANPVTQTVTEGNSGSIILSYALNLDRAPTTPVTFNVAVLAGGTATAGSDFNLLQTTVTFAANQTSQVVNLAEILGDQLPESTEQFTIQITGALTSPVNLGVTVVDTDTGNNFTLTTAADNVNGTANPDVVNGTVSLFGSTFTNADKIDGAGARDVLNLTLNADFGSGLAPAFVANPGANDGFVRNIETLALTNGFNGTRTFDASNITGVDTLTWNASTNGSLNVNGLGATLQNLSITNLAGAGSVALNHVSPVVDTPTDSLNLEVSGVGTRSTATAAAAPATITSTGVTYENVNITAIGNNALNLSATNSVATQSISLKGTGTLELTGVSANLRSFDGSLAQGVIAVNLDTNNNSLATINGGSANDTIAVNGSDLQQNAALNGGSGTDDRFVFTALANNSIVPSILGFETLEFRSITGTNSILAVSGSRDVKTVLLSGTDAGSLTLQNLFDSAGLTVVSNGVANQTVLSVNNIGNATFRTVAATAATAAAPTVVSSAVTFTEATGVGTVEVAANTQFGTATAGEVNFSKASSLAINAVGSLGVTGGATQALAVSADEANTVTFTSSASPNGLVPPLVDYLNLSAVKATNVNLTANRQLELVGSTLTATQNLTINAANVVNATAVNLVNATSVNLSGSNSASKVTLGNIGRGDQTSPVTVNASGLQAGLTLGSVDSMESVSLGLSGVSGVVTVGAVGSALTKNVSVQLSNRAAAATVGVLTGDTVTVNAANSAGLLTIGNGAIANPDVVVKDQLNYTGSGVTASSFDVAAKTGSTALNALLNTGLADDAITITGAASQTSIVVTGNLGAGNNALTINGAASTAGQSINIGNLVGVSTSAITGSAAVDSITGSTGNDVIIGGAGADVITGGAGADVITGGAGADNLTGGSGTDTFVLVEAGLADNAAVVAVLGDTIADFQDGNAVATQDILQISAASLAKLTGFVANAAGLTGAAGAQGANFLVSGAGAQVAGQAYAQLLFNTTNGQLSIDADGTGGVAAVLIGTVGVGATLTSADFLFVA